MKMRLMSIVLVLGILMSCFGVVAGAESLIITDATALKSQIVATYLNKSNVLQWGNKVYMSDDKAVKPYSANGINMIPVEFFVNSLGGSVSIKGEVVSATYSSKKAVFTKDSDQCNVNGDVKKLCHKAEIGGGGKLYAPIKDLCDIFGVYLHEEANGLIFWSKTDVSASLVWNENNLALKKVLEGFLFDDVTGEEIANMIEEKYPGNAHPRLVMTQEKFDAIKEELKKGDGACDAVYWQLYEHLTSYLPAYLSSTPSDYRIEDHGRASEINAEYQNVMLTLAMLYNITDDSMIDNRAAIAEKAYEYMYKAVSFSDWHPGSFLDVAEMAYGVSLCYDWLYNSEIMTAENREIIKEGLYRNAIVPYMNHINDPSCYGTWDWHNQEEGENFCAVISNIAVASMAIVDELSEGEREKAEESIYWAMYDTRRFLSLFAPGGAYPEGNGYWNYAMKYYTCLMQSLQTAAGSDFGYVDVPGMKTTNFFASATKGTIGNFAYHDNSYSKGGKKFQPIMFLADYFDNHAEMKAAAEAITSGYRDKHSCDYVADMCSYNPEKLSGDDVQSTLDAYFPVAETAVMRTGYDTDDTYLGFHCDDPYSYLAPLKAHSHMDAGSFMLDSMGENWFYDLGADDYALNNYGNAYRFRGEGHNTVIFNPTASYSMKMDGKASIVGHEFGKNGGYAIGDMSKAYRDDIGVTSFRRGAKLDKQNSIVTVQDEIRLSKSAEMYWFAHTMADIEVADDGKTAILSQHGKKLKAIIVNGDGAKFSVMDAVPLPTSPVIEGQNPNTGIRKLTIHMDSCKSLDLSIVFVGFESEAYDHPEYFNFVSLDDWGASDAELSEAYNTQFKNKSTEYVYEVSADITATADGDYKFFAASYTEDGSLAGCETQPVYPTAFDTETTVSAKFELANEEYIEDAKNIKFMLWDMNGLKPCMEEIAESTEKELVDVAKGQSTGGSSTKGSLGATDNSGNIVSSAANANNLVDDDPNTGVGFYSNFGTTGNLYVDLGRKYEIDHVEVLAYNTSYGERAGNFSVVASNQVANGVPSSDEDKTVMGYVLPAQKAQTGENAEYKTVKMPVDSINKTYRYISLEKFEENGVGLTVAEVKVYVKESDVPVFVDVTDFEGVTTGGWDSSNGTGAYCLTHLPTSRLIDEVVSADNSHNCGAGFYYNVHTGYMYVDLGKEYKIDHIEITAYDNQRPKNCAEYDLVVSKNIPDSKAYDSSNSNGEMLVATPEYNAAATNLANGVRTFYLPEDSGEYRYVSLEQFTDRGDRYGLVVQEVRVYVNEKNLPKEDEPEVDEPEEVTYIDVTDLEGVTTGGWDSSNGSVGYGLTHLPTSRLIDEIVSADNAHNCSAGFYYNVRTGYMYVDLGRKYKIDHIEVTAYNEQRPMNGALYDLVVSNNIPDNQPYDGENPNGELLVATPDYNVNATNLANGVRTFYLPENSGEYRYVSLEQFVDKGDRFGLTVQEVRVYVKESDMPYIEPVATNVALGKGANGIMSRGCLSGYGDLSVVTDGALCVGGNSKQIISYLGAWYCLDLGESYDIEKVMVDAVTNDYTSQTSIYLSSLPADPATGLPLTKTTILDGAADTAAWGAATKTIELDEAVNARYVIVHRPSGASGGNLRIGEIEAWGK